MEYRLGGLHHVTAVTGRASENLRFYTKVLGLRLVKKTVNQDVTSSYHLFYADEVGTPGTDMTFFDWPNVPVNGRGYGEVSATGFTVPNGSLEWWAAHLDASVITHGGIEERNGRRLIALADTEEQRLELVEGDNAGAVPWPESPVPIDKAIRGLAAVTFTVGALEPTGAVLEKILCFRRCGEYAFADNPSRRAFVFETGNGGLGTEVHIEARPDLPRARTGVGGVHHVAFRTPNDEEHKAWREHIAQARMPVTEVIDRYYFKSIYFREPGGVLFEIATDGPGFAQDEDVAHLGERLSLPPFLEGRRAEIEGQLAPI